MAEISTKPYLIRAIHEWCEDSGYRPYIAVVVDERTQVPQEFVRNGEIVLNVSAQATHRLRIGNDFVEFEARFSGAVRSVSIPVDNISAIYAQETGHGMAFDVVRGQSPKSPQVSHPRPVSSVPARSSAVQSAPEHVEATRPAPVRAGRPSLVPKPKAVETDADSHAQSAPAMDLDVKARSSAKSAKTEVPADSTASAEATHAPARKPRSPRRRAQPSGTGDAVTQAKVKVPPDQTDDPTVLPQGARQQTGSSAEPPAEPPTEPPKPARGHLKRIK